MNNPLKNSTKKAMPFGCFHVKNQNFSLKFIARIVLYGIVQCYIKTHTQSCLIVLKIWLPLIGHLQSKHVWINTFSLSLSLCCLTSRFDYNQGLMSCFTKLYFTYVEKKNQGDRKREARIMGRGCRETKWSVKAVHCLLYLYVNI